MLILPIKQKWFDMIVGGMKREEYRDLTPYYDSRFLRHEDEQITVCFCNGYRKDSPQAVCVVTPRREHVGLPAWGAERGKFYWVLEIDSVKEVINNE